jgi:hypothetical protein
MLAVLSAKDYISAAARIIPHIHNYEREDY